MPLVHLALVALSLYTIFVLKLLMQMAQNTVLKQLNLLQMDRSKPYWHNVRLIRIFKICVQCLLNQQILYHLES